MFYLPLRHWPNEKWNQPATGSHNATKREAKQRYSSQRNNVVQQYFYLFQKTILKK